MSTTRTKSFIYSISPTYKVVVYRLKSNRAIYIGEFETSGTVNERPNVFRYLQSVGEVAKTKLCLRPKEREEWRKGNYYASFKDLVRIQEV